MNNTKNKFIEGTYCKIFDHPKDINLIYKKYKYGILDFTSLKEIAIYKIIEESDYFLKLLEINNITNTIILKKYKYTLSNINLNKLTIEQKLKIMKYLLKSVNYLHSNYIIHRDLKMDNILINNEDDIKIIDFGLGYIGIYNDLICEDLDFNVYTESYKSYEIINNFHYDNKTDIYALGIIFLKLLTSINEKELDKIINNFHYEYYKKFLLKKEIYVSIFKKYLINCLYLNYKIEINDLIFDLICRMIINITEYRYTIKECIEHPLFSDIYNKEIAPININNKIIYMSDHNRKYYLNILYNLGKKYSLSINTIMCAFLICDNFYYNLENKNIIWIYEYDFTNNCIFILGSYISNVIDDYYYDNFIYNNNDNNTCIKKILEILDYKLYYNNPLIKLIELLKEDKYNYININNINIYLDNIIKNYFNKKYDNTDDLINNSLIIN